MQTLSAQFPDLPERLRVLRDTLLHHLVERDTAVRLALLAALAGEHLLLIGPPGTAKSLLARRLRLAFRDATYFERLLTRFSVPEELFGPLSIRALEQDRYVRHIDGYLPTASIAFLDEIFKANSAVLNALLTLLNERAFDNGDQRIETPLITVLGASNELPAGEELDALYDRFLLRLYVGPVTDQGFAALLGLRGNDAPVVPAELVLTRDLIIAVQTAAHEVAIPEDVLALLTEMRTWLAEQQIAVSDRRWRKIVHLLQVSALSNGRDAVSVWDAWLLQHCIWHTPEQRDAVHEWYTARVGARATADPERLTKLCGAWESRLERDRASRSQAHDKKGKPLFTDAKGGTTTSSTARMQKQRGGEPLYLAPPQTGHDRSNNGNGHTRKELDQLRIPSHYYHGTRFSEWDERDSYLADTSNWLIADIELKPLLEPTRYSEAHIADCVRQVDVLVAKVQKYMSDLDEHIESLNALIDTHLWITDGFAAPARRSLEQTRASTRTLLGRLQSIRRGFDSLPREIIAPIEP